MFSRENSKLQMIETARVNKRKQASTNQRPVGDDVSTLHPLRSSVTAAMPGMWAESGCGLACLSCIGFTGLDATPQKNIDPVIARRITNQGRIAFNTRSRKGSVG
jgi:hypothetical protein